MKTVITNAGIEALLNAGMNGPQIKVTRVEVGSSIISPTPDMSTFTDTVWEGDSEYIQYQVVDQKTFMFKVTLDESIGDFEVGNVRLILEDGTVFTVSALQKQRMKLANNPPQVGDRQIFVIPIVLSGVSGLVDVTVIVPDEASLPFVQTEQDLPQPNLSAYSVYEVMYHTTLRTSVLALRTENSWLFVKGQSGQEGGSFNPGDFQEGTTGIGVLVYYDKIANEFKPADGLDPSKGYLGVQGSLYNVVSNGAFYNPNWNLIPGNDYFAAGGDQAGQVTSVANNFYVGRAINQHTLLLGSVCETIVNKTSVINYANPTTVKYTNEKAVVDYVTMIQNQLQADIDTRAKVDMSNVGDVTFLGSVTFNQLIIGTAQSALWS